MKKIFPLILILLASINIWSQQDAQYTQYMYNMSVINPAYTTSDIGTLNLGILHRSQWVGVNGAPKTSSLFAHKPINDKIEIGFSIMHDNIGDVVKENNLFADFAYKLNFKENSQLSFGLKTGVSFFNVDFSNFQLESGSVFTDPNFTENINNTFFNIGAGVYYNTDNYYVGLSVPNFLPSKHIEENNGKYQGTENAHWFLTAGYVFDINKVFKLKPAFMMKAVKGAPIALDLTANMLYEKIEFGVGYRLDDSISGLVNIRVTPKLRIGYAYDYTTSNLGAFNSGSHEIIILYDLKTLTKGFDKSPRFF